MKKLVLCTIMMLFIVGIAGCSKEKIVLTADNISENTIFAKSNGELQVATVEDFGQTYYKLGELEEYIAKEVDLYNQTAGAEKVTVDNVQLRDGKAIMLLTYTGMDQYAAFNEASAAYFNGGIKDIPLDMPATLVNTKNGSLTSTLEIMQNEKYKILVMNEPVDIIVDGKVKYYSDNAALVDDNKIKSAAEGMTIVVFKP